jgi:extradiol dioxygenase family protein
VDSLGDADPTNPVDGDAIPVRHFGAILSVSDWETIAAKLRTAGTPFVLEPKIRFAGGPGEQGTFFVRDPSGNVLEFKSFRDTSRIFATDLE